MRMSDWSSDVCSSDLILLGRHLMRGRVDDAVRFQAGFELFDHLTFGVDQQGFGGKFRELDSVSAREPVSPVDDEVKWLFEKREGNDARPGFIKRTGDCQFRRAQFQVFGDLRARAAAQLRSEEHTSELQSLMRTSYAGFCL